MNRQVKTIIDVDKCIGCGRCVQVCPDRTLALVDGKARIVSDRSLQCGQCAAVCPEEAIQISSLFADAWSLATVHPTPAYTPPGGADVSALCALMQSRRSCRVYTDDPVPREVIEDLVKIGTMAPSATNSQAWRFTILPDRPAVLDFAGSVSRFFENLNRLSELPVLKHALKLAGKPELKDYYDEYHDTVVEALDDFQKRGIDRLFHGAPAAIVISSARGGSMPVEDASLASQNILLAAHAMGYGTCLIGFVVHALNSDAKVRRALSMPHGERANAVIAIGRPAFAYQRPTGRLAAKPRYACEFGDKAESEQQGLAKE